MKLGVFIPGRLDSERLPNKLVLPLGESCLWDMACQKLSRLPEEYNKYVLCYDDELVEIASKYEPHLKVILRDKDTTQVDGPLTYIFKELEPLPDTHLMFLNPCLSFLSSESIEAALSLFEEREMDYATSVKPFQNWLFNEDGPIMPIDYRRLTTKEIEPAWQAAHCFHVFNKDVFFQDGMMLKSGHGLLPVKEEETIDVDTPMDYEFAKWKHARKYVIDVDGTLCYTENMDYSKAQPLLQVIQKVNRLYEAGNTIVIQTARGYESGINWRKLTEYQLSAWGLKYHTLLMDKPSADVYIDDKALNVEDWQ